MEKTMKTFITGALAASFLCFGLPSGAFAAMGAPAHPQGLSDLPSVHMVRQANPGHHYGWARGKHRGHGYAHPAHPRTPARGAYPR